jgi:hypothetical protein
MANQLMKNEIITLLNKRLKMCDDNLYKKYIGRNRRFTSFANDVKYDLSHAMDRNTRIQIGYKYKKYCNDFRQTPTFDISKIGQSLKKFDDNIYSLCADYFQSTI